MADEGLSLGLGLELSLGVGRSARPDAIGISNVKRNCLSDLFGSRIGALEAEAEAEAAAEGLRVNLNNGENLRMPSPSRSEGRNEDECSRGSDDDAAAGSDPSRKKLRLSKYQSLLLEDTFKEHSTLNPIQKLGLAKQLNLKPRQVEVWFQNRRARTKLKQTEVDCDYLKRCCERLREENRRLQKEAQDLRALKLSSQVYMHMNPPTTLTMCPSCEKIAVSSTPAPSTSATTPAECLPRAANLLAHWPALHVPL